MVSTIDQAEKNLIEVAGLITAFPGALLNFRKEIQNQTTRGLKRVKFAKLILELVLSESKPTETIPLSYILRRASSQPLDADDNEFVPVVITLLKDATRLAVSEQEAVWRIQERLIENLGILAPTDKDALHALKDQTRRAQSILSTEPKEDSEIFMPFAALSEVAGVVENERLPRRPSGVLVFDQECLQGGFVQGTSVLISGIINTGKSYLLSHLLKEDGFLGGNPLLCSLEDNKSLTQLRWSSFLLGVSPDKIERLTNEELTDQIRKKYAKEPHKLLAISRIRLWCPNTPSISDITQKIDELERTTGTVITRFGVDYIQNINDSTQIGDTRAERLYRAANELYRFAELRKKNALIVTQSKAKEETSNAKFLGLNEALAESVLIGRNAHYLLTMKVTGAEEERRLLERDKRSRINIAFKKNKFGPKDAFFAIFNGDKGQWHFFRTETEREQAWNAL